MSIDDDRKVVADVGDMVECIYVEPAYNGMFTVGKKYKVLELVSEQQRWSMVDKCLAFRMIGNSIDTDWNPPRRMFRGRNTFNCKHNCRGCKDKCDLWEKE